MSVDLLQWCCRGTGDIMVMGRAAPNDCLLPWTMTLQWPPLSGEARHLNLIVLAFEQMKR